MRASPADAVRHFEARFRAIGSPERARTERAYMKSTLRFHGIAAKLLRDECAAFCKVQREVDREMLVAVVDALFATDGFDLRSAAIGLLERNVALFSAKDSPWLAELARRGACWAHVDWLVTKVIAPVLDGDASLSRRVRAWANDRDFWVRRVALLAQLGALRRGDGNFELFTEVAVPMLEEREFFIRKAIGWVLREVSKKRPALVRGFLVEHGAHASGVTWREATKYLPAAMRRQVEAARNLESTKSRGRRDVE
jgi:3-methyladenine DNA glycosylase AlkD